MTAKIGIIGAGGFTGFELIKILEKHRFVSLKVINSSKYNGQKVSKIIHIKNENLRFTNFNVEDINKINLDLLFLAMPNGEAMKIISQLKCKVIDLSADYRFNDKKLFEEVYGIKHTDNKNKAEYGLPELNRKQIKNAKLIGNPGCYVTSCILAGLPLLKIYDYIVFDCKSGYSGAGRDSEYIKDPNLIKDNIIPYKLTKHRHRYEIQQILGRKISFTPHVINTFQGLLCTAHIFLKNSFIKKFKNNKKLMIKEIIALFESYYKNEKFVKIIKEIPNLHAVQGTNDCVIGGFEIDENNQLVVISVIDNLIKGASGQAVQNMNLMLGYNEDEGLIN